MINQLKSIKNGQTTLSNHENESGFSIEVKENLLFYLECVSFNAVEDYDVNNIIRRMFTWDLI